MHTQWLIDWHNKGNGTEIVELLSKYYKKPIKNDIYIWEKLNKATGEIEQTNDYKDLDMREVTQLFWWNRLSKPAMITIEKLKHDNKLSRFTNYIEERKKKSIKPKQKRKTFKRCSCK